jgi:predicted secreted protein
MAVGLGTSWLVQVNTGTSISPTWETIANQRNADVSFDAEQVDITSKSDFGWANFLSSVRKWSIDVDGEVDESDSTLAFLLTSFRNGADVGIRILSPNGQVWYGTSALNGPKFKMPYDGVVEYSATFAGKGQITFA